MSLHYILAHVLLFQIYPILLNSPSNRPLLLTHE